MHTVQGAPVEFNYCESTSDIQSTDNEQFAGVINMKYLNEYYRYRDTEHRYCMCYRQASH